MIPTAHWRRRGLIATVATVLAALPGVGGLGYEASLLLAPVMALAGAMTAVDVIRKLRADHSGAQLDTVIHRVLRELLQLHGISISLLALGSLWQGDSGGLGDGLLFYLLGPLISSLMGAVAGLWGGLLSSRRWLQILIALSPAGFCLMLGAWRLYHDPVVFVFDPFLGHFAGPIYDEDVSVSTTYWLYRGYNLAAALAALTVWRISVDTTHLRIAPSRLAHARLGQWLMILVLGALSTSVAVQPERFGFHATVESICESLRATRVTEHFVIHYEPTSQMEDVIDTAALEHEFAWHRLEKMLGQTPEAPVHSFLFTKPEQKRKLMGAGDVEVAAPWRRHIYIDHTPFPGGALHHELAHVFGAPFGDPVFGVSLRFPFLNMGLVEGFAVACDFSVGDGLDVHERSAIILQLERLPALDKIMGPEFWVSAPAAAYTAAGSFCSWLRDTRGMNVLTDLYGNAGDFEASCGTTLGALETDWLEFLRSCKITENDVEIWRQRFESRSIFDRRHAHQIAALQAEINRLAPLGHHEEIIAAYRSICELEPDHPPHQVAFAQALGRADRFDEAIAVLEAQRTRQDLSPRLHSQIEERLGDIALHTGSLAASIASYDRALQFPASGSKRRVLQLKRYAAADATLAPVIGEYFGTFISPQSDEIQRLQRMTRALVINTLPGHKAVGQYLIGIQALASRSQRLAASHLERCLAPHLDGSRLPNKEFEHNARRLLVNALCLKGDFERARTVLSELRAIPTARNGERLGYEIWQERIDFFEAARLPVPRRGN